MHKWLYVGLEERTNYELSKSVYLMGQAPLNGDRSPPEYLHIYETRQV
jgi:hypothetical protein